MNISISQNAKTTVLLLEGRLDTNTAPLLQEKLNALADCNELVLDFGSLVYISSAGLRVLLTAQKKATAQGSKMILRHVNDSVMDIFQMTGFADILMIEG